MEIRLDEAFLFERSIDIETCDQHAEKLREELTLARIDRHAGQLNELDVEFDGNRFVRTGATAPAFSYLRRIEIGNEGWWTRTAPVGTVSRAGCIV